MSGIGLFIVGDEILEGRRKDAHLQAVIHILKCRGLSLSWVRIVGDELELLVDSFRETLKYPGWVFSTGGIGGTPDDLTRSAVAAAAGVNLKPHPEGLELLKARFGEDLTQERQRMVEFPEGAELIPNPVNQIPGFSYKRHYFVPGFPQMAAPMIEWVLDNNYPGLAGEKRAEYSLRIAGTPESRLIPLMEKILALYPDIKVFSLPSIGVEKYTIELGVKGPAEKAREAWEVLKAGLGEMNIVWDEA